MTARVRVRVDELGRIATAQGLRSRYALAKRLGVNRSTVSRVLDGDRAPGQQFIAATMHELGVPFDAAFEIVDSVTGGVAELVGNHSAAQTADQVGTAVDGVL
jgi:transcriptional regulator with XRE-family HTH domain